ncbi:MAG: glutamate--cysteine ligase [SAR324 cluster bacterium]|nr:glutamate--cysteine ligase [SAR324 cluster bacterium]MBL7034898.1 glutamate--cysteine ligase [SAR324 cluster bacterium]
MNISELKSLFIDYCRNENGASDKQLFGLEYENFVLVPQDANPNQTYSPMPIEGETGVFSVLDNLAELTKDDEDPLEKVYENEMLLALKSPAGSKVTIEPGGQIELSDRPRSSLSEADKSLKSYLKLLNKAVSDFDGRLLFQGVQPLHAMEDLPFFPKKRYQIMFPHMLNTGTLGQWMMKASTGVQVSIDYASIEDLERKFVILNRLSPFLTALFANSPLVGGSPSGYLSYRSHIWENTDNSRSGLQDQFLVENFCLDDYIEWALKAVPYHLMREDKVVQTTDYNFQELLDDKHPDLKITMEDWEEHLGMLFPVIRIKNIMEVRVLDSISPRYTSAVPALIGTLLYNETAFSSVQSILMDLPLEDYQLYKKAVNIKALQAEVNQTNFAKTGRRLVEIALEALGSEDEKWLMPYFEQYTKEGLTPADETLELFKKCGENPEKWLADVLKKDDY